MCATVVGTQGPRRGGRGPWRTVRIVTSVLTLVLSACGPEIGPTQSRLRFRVGDIAMDQFESRQLIVELVRPNGTIVLIHDAQLGSLDTGIVTVSASGLLRSTGPRGNTLVTASRDGLADTIPVTVRVVPDTIGFDPPAPLVPQNGSIVVSATTYDRAGDPIPEMAPTLRLLSSGVLTLADGVVTVVGPGGGAAIEAVAGDLVDTVVVLVIQVAESLAAYPRALAIRQNTREFLAGYLFDLFGAPMSGPIVRTSADSAIASFDGDVLGVSPGQTVVTLSAAGEVDSVPVTVFSAALDPLIAIHLPTPAAPSSIVSAGSSNIYVAVPGAGVILWLEWAHWGFVDTLRVGSEPRHLAAIGDGWVYAALANPPALVRINATTNAETARVPLDQNPLGLALAWDGSRAFVLGEEGTIVAVSTLLMTVVDSLTFPGSGDIQSHPSAPLLYLAAPDSGVVWVALSDTLALQDRWPVGGVPRSVAVGVARDELYVANAGGTLDVLALATGTPLSSINVGESVVAVSVTESGVYAVAPTGTVYKMSPISTSVVDALVTGGIPGRIRAVGDSSVHVVLNGAGWVDFLWGF